MALIGALPAKQGAENIDGRLGFSSSATLGCAIFAIVFESVAYLRPTNPHSQVWLCYPTLSAACKTMPCKNLVILPHTPQGLLLEANARATREVILAS
jgi:hypothetical protein